MQLCNKQIAPSPSAASLAPSSLNLAPHLASASKQQSNSPSMNNLNPKTKRKKSIAAAVSSPMASSQVAPELNLNQNAEGGVMITQNNVNV